MADVDTAVARFNVLSENKQIEAEKQEHTLHFLRDTAIKSVFWERIRTYMLIAPACLSVRA